MKFGPIPTDAAKGAVLAHSLRLDGQRFRKGRVLDAADITALLGLGVEEVIVAQMEPGEITEDAAAERLARAICAGQTTGLSADQAFTGRVNLRAQAPGILRIDGAAVERVNAIDPAITLATLPPWQRVTRAMMVATVKIIPYAVPAAAVAAAEAAAAGALSLVRPVMTEAGLIITELSGAGRDEKAVAITQARLAQLDVRLVGVERVAHDTAAIASALDRLPGEMALILTASATSDEADVGPAGLLHAGGVLTRFGMPVDPGNLLFLGDLRGRPVIGLPGCARSPALNGADWVMERVICGVPPTAQEIAAMGVGGLLKEIPTRPAPRERKGRAPDLAAP